MKNGRREQIARYYDMDFSELAKIIFCRVQELEPENVAKITGCILLKESKEQEMFELAYASEHILLSKINDAKVMLEKLSPISCISSVPYDSCPPPMNFHAPYWNPHFASEQQLPNHSLKPYASSVGEEFTLCCNQAQVFGVEERTDTSSDMSKSYYQDPSLSNGMPLRNFRNFAKICHYFNKGYCRHGMNCRYFHGQSFSDGEVLTSDMNDFANQEKGFVSASMEKLEVEITELLRSKRGTPVSIVSLPMLYFDKYGRHLQAEGYLTESQRHGKAGLSLTKLLHRLSLNKSIKVIDRPNGQPSVILTEDAPKYTECRNGRNDSGSTVSSSHQIYLTFPADSTFTEDDVSDYFKRYGQVRDVRIPCQDRRMFGFVSFVYPETVDAILKRQHPHYICGARVLVKPYRERSRNTERAYTEKLKPLTYYRHHYLEIDPDTHEMARESYSSRILKKQPIEHQGKMVEFERMRLSDLSMAPQTLIQQSELNYGMEDFNVSEAPGDFCIDHFSFAFDALKNSTATAIDEEARHGTNSYGDHESVQIEVLPESPFGVE